MQECWPVALPWCAGSPLSFPGRLHLPEMCGDPEQVSSPAGRCPSGKRAAAGGSGIMVVRAQRASVVQQRRCLGRGGQFARRGGVARALLGGRSLKRRGQRLQPRAQWWHRGHTPQCAGVTTSPLGTRVAQNSWSFTWPRTLF